MRCPSCNVPLSDPAASQCPFCKTIVRPDAPAPGARAIAAPVLEALAVGNKIEAIKRYREVHRVGLKEAKDAVEAIAAGQSPPIHRGIPRSRDVPVSQSGGGISFPWLLVGAIVIFTAGVAFGSHFVR